jgi:hypothetical protein
VTRFAGVVGYGESQEVPPESGDWKDVITERQYFGRVITNSRRIQAEGQVNFDLSLQNSIEIVADAYARDNMEKLRYVMWRGNRWTVDEITDQHPRLRLRMGELYTGPIPEEPEDEPEP